MFDNIDNKTANSRWWCIVYVCNNNIIHVVQNVGRVVHMKQTSLCFKARVVLKVNPNIFSQKAKVVLPWSDAVPVNISIHHMIRNEAEEQRGLFCNVHWQRLALKIHIKSTVRILAETVRILHSLGVLRNFLHFLALHWLISAEDLVWLLVFLLCSWKNGLRPMPCGSSPFVALLQICLSDYIAVLDSCSRKWWNHHRTPSGEYRKC